MIFDNPQTWLPEFPGSRQAGLIIQNALNSVSADQAVCRHVKKTNEALQVGNMLFNLSVVSKIYVIGAGKASIKMAKGLHQVLGDRIAGGVIITKHLYPEANELPANIEILIGSHPVLDEQSVNSTQKLIHYCKRFLDTDLVFCLISGGGSSLLSCPHDGIQLGEFQALIRNLLSSGADISEMNTVRKHLDQVKGGGLARLTGTCQLITLILSDVIGSPLDVIASGPTSPDPTTFSEAIQILDKYHLQKMTAASIRKILEEGKSAIIPETLKKQHPRFEKVYNHVIGSNEIAALCAVETAKNLGFQSMLLTTFLNGEAREAGKLLAALIREVDHSGLPIPRPACIVAGGETTVTLHGDGKGGRNQELALGAVVDLAEIKNIALITLATDGEDGITDAAGAVVTGETFSSGKKLGLYPAQYLQNNDSYHYFERLRQIVRTGATGTNVNDLSFLFAF